MISLLPKNKGHFEKLIPFAKMIISICKKLGFTPILYGSYSHFTYTKDKNMKVNDIDLLIPRRYFEKIVKELKIAKIKYKYYPQWDTLIISDKYSRVELDAIESCYRDSVWNKKMPQDFKSFDFDGIKIKIISLNGLIALYKVAYARTKDDKIKIRARIRRLEKSLGRRILK